jgi:hypothetical protein
VPSPAVGSDDIYRTLRGFSYPEKEQVNDDNKEIEIDFINQRPILYILINTKWVFF